MLQIDYICDDMRLSNLELFSSLTKDIFRYFYAKTFNNKFNKSYPIRPAISSRRGKDVTFIGDTLVLDTIMQHETVFCF